MNLDIVIIIIGMLGQVHPGALAQYKAYYSNNGGDSNDIFGVPVEDDGGNGTAGGHPDEVQSGEYGKPPQYIHHQIVN